MVTRKDNSVEVKAKPVTKEEDVRIVEQTPETYGG